MLKNILFLLVLGLLSCTNDPLQVETVTTDETATSDGLRAVDVQAAEDSWTNDNGILTATGPASLELLPGHEALTFGLSFRIDEAASGRLLLGGQHALTIPSLDLDSTGDKRMEVNITPGVWQNLDLAYLPADGDDPSLLVGAYLNGNLVYYQQPLADLAGDPGPLSLELESGTMSVTNVRSLDRAGKSSTLTDKGEVELNLPLIRYAYYELDGNPDEFDAYDEQEPSKQGYISRFDIDGIRESLNSYAIRFSSDLDIPKAGDYTFYLRTNSMDRLYIDGDQVLDMGENGGSIDGEVTVELGEGSHELRLDHHQTGSWNHLKLKYAFEDQQRASLNDMPEDRAVATPGSPSVLEVEPDDRPYLLRSFLNFPLPRVYDFTDKRTHVINVGEADGPHYSYDLRNGSILQVWRGAILDAGDMWDGRGEPQVARPLGPVVAFDGRPQWSDDAADRWPQENRDFRHLRYELDGAGRPTFYFASPKGGELSDAIEPTEGGMRRTLTNRSDDETLYTTVVAAASIRETGPGTFELVNPGLNLRIDDLAAGGLRLMEGSGSQRLVAEIPPGEHLTYSFDW